MAHFGGTFELKSSENFDEYLVALGVNPLLRTVGGCIKPTLAVTVGPGGTHFRFRQETPATGRSYTLEFDLGVRFNNKTIDGRLVKSVVVLEDGRLVQRDRPVNPDGKEGTFIREINSEGDLVMICQVDDVVARRVYQRMS